MIYWIGETLAIDATIFTEKLTGNLVIYELDGQNLNRLIHFNITKDTHPPDGM